MNTAKRLIAACALVAALLALLALAAQHLAVRSLQPELRRVLGPRAEVRAVVTGWISVELRGVRVPAPAGWPAESALQAERITVRPDLFGLFSQRMRIPKVTVDHAYLPIVRARDGTLRLLPGLSDGVAGNGNTNASGAVTALSIGTVELRHALVDLIDESIRAPASTLRVHHLHARIDNLDFPPSGRRSPLQIDGFVKGPENVGRISVGGWIEPAQRSAELAARLQGVDVAELQSYLLRPGEPDVQSGTLDLMLKASLQRGRLHASGSATLRDLELARGGTGATFIGLPNAAVASALERNDWRTVIEFAVDGTLDDPRFSWNDSLAQQLHAGLARSLGLAAPGAAARSAPIGEVVKRLFGK